MRRSRRRRAAQQAQTGIGDGFESAAVKALHLHGILGDIAGDFLKLIIQAGELQAFDFLTGQKSGLSGGGLGGLLGGFSKLFGGGGFSGANNRVSMLSFGNGTITTGWVINDNNTGNAASIYANVSGGRPYIQVNVSAGAAGQIVSICGDYNTKSPSGGSTAALYAFPARAGERLAISCLTGTSNISTQALDVAWLDANGLVSNGIAESTVFIVGGTGFPTVEGGFVTVPAGAVAGVLVLRGTTAAAGNVSPLCPPRWRPFPRHRDMLRRFETSALALLRTCPLRWAAAAGADREL